MFDDSDTPRSGRGKGLKEGTSSEGDTTTDEEEEGSSGASDSDERQHKPKVRVHEVK